VKKTSFLVLALALFATPAITHAQEVAPVTTQMKVHWHKSLDAAIEAARKTGKPVLHFQLLGDLDQEFC